MNIKLARWKLVFRATAVLFLALAMGLSIPSRVSSQTNTTAVNLIREIELGELGLQSPIGLAYSPGADLLLVLHGPMDQGGRTVSMLSRYERLAGSSELETAASNPLDVAFNAKGNSLFVFDPSGQRLQQIPAEQDGKLPPQASAAASSDLHGLGIGQAQGITFDPRDGRLFVLDPSGRHLVIITPDEQGSYSVGPAASQDRITRIDLKDLGEKHLRGLAFDPAKDRLYTLDPESKTLYEFDEALENTQAFDISSLELVDPQAVVIAPSGDLTDDPSIQDLYITDPGRNFIVEVSLTTPVLVAALPPLRTDLVLIQTVRTSNWNPPSPDPTGLEYFPSKNKLIVSDSEVDEMSIYQGANVYLTSLGGSLSSTCDTTSFSKEPTGVAVNPSNDHVFFTDDVKDKVFEINPGSDGKYCTGDDSRTSFSTFDFNDTDPEGVTYGRNSLFVTDGLNAEIYRVTKGSNGQFDGVPPAGDDEVSHFDTAGLGIADPESVGYHPVNDSLFIVSRKDDIMVETTINGDPLNIFDLSFLNPRGPSGAAPAPSSADPQVYSIYISDRGVDNNNDPNENDGKIFEVMIGNNPPPPPAGDPLFFSLANSGTYSVGTVSGVRDEDVVYFDGSQFSMVYDGSDVGAGGADVSGFYQVNSTTLLLSFNAAVTLPNVGAVDAWDIVQFDATSLGNTTAGAYSLYFDGSQVGLDTSAEKIDAFHVLPDGRVLISITGNSTISGVAAKDEDVLAFTPTSLGATTRGSWAMYFDGSDVGLDTDSGEDVNGISVDTNGNIYLTTLGAFSVSGVSGTSADVFVCAPTSLGNTTACNYSSTLYFQASTYGITSNDLDALDVP